MSRQRKKIHINHNSEFELDLAPLLAVMVKLVPVLLVSSAFIQVMTIETQLPQVVKEAIKEQESNPLQQQLSADIDLKTGITLHYTEKGSELQTEVIANTNEGRFDHNNLQQKLSSIKMKHPEIFKLEVKPSDDVPYQEIVKILDTARSIRNQGKPFRLTNKTTGKEEFTDMMFPEVVFANVFEN